MELLNCPTLHICTHFSTATLWSHGFSVTAGGRLDQLAALGSQLRAAAIAATNAAATAFNAHAVALNPHQQQHPYQQQQNPYQQVQHQQNQLPPLAPNPGMRAPAGSSGSGDPYGGPTTTTSNTLPAVRRPQLEPVTHSTPMATSGGTPANGATWAPHFPQPPPGEVPSTPGPGRRRGVLGFFKDLRDMVQQDGRTAAAALAAATAAAATAAAAALVPYGQPSPPPPQPLTMAVGVPVGQGPAAPARHGSVAAGALGPYMPQPPQQPPAQSGSGPQGAAFPRRLGSGSEGQAAAQFGAAGAPGASAAPAAQGPQAGRVPSGQPDMQPGGAASGAQGGQQEPAHQFHDLVVPGTVYLIERRGECVHYSVRWKCYVVLLAR